MKKLFLILVRLLSLGALSASQEVGVIGASSYTARLTSKHLFSSASTTLDAIYFNIPAPYNVTVTDTELTGYLWGPLVGYVNLNCNNTGGCATSNFKVQNVSGQLSGYAFGENAGWISFSCANAEINNCSSNGYASTSINADGEFVGYAFAQNFGWIHFDCNSSASCVKTDWRKLSNRTIRAIEPGTTTGASISSSGGSPSTQTENTSSSSAKNLFDGICIGASCLSVPIPSSVLPIVDNKKPVTAPPESRKKVYRSALYFLENGAVIGEASAFILDEKGKPPITLAISHEVAEEKLFSITSGGSASNAQNSIRTTLIDYGIVYKISVYDLNKNETLLSGRKIRAILPVPTLFSESKTLYLYGKVSENDTWKLIKKTPYWPTITFETTRYQYYKVSARDDREAVFPFLFVILILAPCALVIFLAYLYTKKHGRKHTHK